MKILVLALTVLTLTSCSSLITRGDLNECNQKCNNQIEKLSKDDGKVSCVCKSEKVSSAKDFEFVPCGY